MLSVENLSFRKGNKTILNKVSFRLRPGEFMAILGSNGAGKSTLIKLITRQQEASSGSIHFRDREIHSYSMEQLSTERSVLTQQLNLAFQFTVEEVVMMGRYPHFKGQAREEDVHAVRKALHHSELSSYTKRVYNTLSGGEQQRTQIARVFTQLDEGEQTSGKLLLLDEPLNNLDIKHQHEVLHRAIEFAHEGNMVIAVLHDINMATQYADQILMLKKGEQLAYGPVEKVIRQDLLETCYDMPVHIMQHPQYSCPMVCFGSRHHAQAVRIKKQLNNELITIEP